MTAGRDLRLITSAGEVEIELYWHHAPKTCENVYELARRHYYDDTLVHRISPGYLIQLGDPTGTGTGGECFTGGFMDDEIHPDLRHTGAGVVSMANTGKPNTNGSQFFITLCPCPQLDKTHTIFGRIKSGMSVVARIAKLPVTRDERPQTEVRVHKVLVTIPGLTL